MTIQVPLRIQVGAVVALFLGALLTLGITGASLVAREGRRTTARAVLDEAGHALEARGAPILARAPKWPDDPGAKTWVKLDQELGEAAIQVLSRFEAVEGGYYLENFQRFLGSAFPTAPPPPDVPETTSARNRTAGPPPREYFLIENQVIAAIAADQPLFLVKDVPPSTVAIRTAPVKAQGKLVGATWLMIRLVDPFFLDRSIRGYQLAAGLALGGIGLALALTIGLVRTVRRQTLERAQLQVELRRSERLAALGKLIAGVAHEIRNPLAGIRSTIQLWQRGIGPDAESMADVVAEADRMEAIVARLLEFSRANVQRLAPGNLNDVVADSARLARVQAQAQNVQIQVELEPNLPLIQMSPSALIQVFRNLTTNALQAMPKGGILRLSTRHHLERRMVEAEVADTGPGLGPDVTPHLFEPFFTTRSEDTGLGLAIAREIALAHYGQLQPVLGPGQSGTIFRLSLPIFEPADRQVVSDIAV
jgi:signal transduction histidine kinase